MTKSIINVILCALALLTVGASAQAFAQSSPLKGVTDWIGVTTPSGEPADFVRASRVDPNQLDYKPTTGPEKKRVRVRTQAEVDAEMRALSAGGATAQARSRGLSNERLPSMIEEARRAKKAAEALKQERPTP